MNTLEDLILPSDLAQLFKDDLKSLSLNLNLPIDGSNATLAEAIWKAISHDRILKHQTLASLTSSRLLAGKTSIIWLRPNHVEMLQDIKEALIRRSDFDIFQTTQFPDTITSEPHLFGGYYDNNNATYILRFVMNVGQSSRWVRDELITTPQTSIVTALYFANQGTLEVRADPTVATKIASYIANAIDDHLTFRRVELGTTTGSDISDFVDALNGRLVEAVTKPELILSEFTPEQAKAVAEILSALDQFFSDDNGEKLLDTVRREGQNLMVQLVPIPLTALILMGLDKVGLGGTDHDLRKQPLYDFLRPYLQHQKGFLKVTVDNQGVQEDYTIRIGLTTNSVYFPTPASEAVIQYVRERIVFR